MEIEEAREYLETLPCSCPYGTSATNCHMKYKDQCKHGDAVRTAVDALSILIARKEGEDE